MANGPGRPMMAPVPVHSVNSSPGPETLGRLGSTRSWRRFTTEVVDGPWARLADLVADPAAMDAWVETELAGTAAGHRDLAGSLVVYRLAGSLAELAIVPLLAEQRTFVLTPERLWLSFGENARIAAVGLPGPVVAVLGDDPDAGRAGTVVVADPAQMHTLAAEGLAVSFAGLPRRCGPALLSGCPASGELSPTMSRTSPCVGPVTLPPIRIGRGMRPAQ